MRLLPKRAMLVIAAATAVAGLGVTSASAAELTAPRAMSMPMAHCACHPMGHPSWATTPENTPVTIPVLNDDTDVTSPKVIETLPAGNGTTVVNPDGTITYTPNNDFFGTDTFRYIGQSGTGSFFIQTVTVLVTAPMGHPSFATTPENTPVTIPVLNDDTDVTSPSVISTLPASNGTTVVNPDGTITYTPNNGFIGTDTFRYIGENGVGAPFIETVTVTVTPC